MMEDAYDKWEHHEYRLNNRLMARPICSVCREHIQSEHYYDIYGTSVCPECLENYFRLEIDDY